MLDSTIDYLEKFFDNIVVVVAVDGLDGLEKYKEHNIDLILTDIHMSKMNGLEMVKTELLNIKGSF